MTNSFLKLATEGNKAAILKQQIICQYILGGDSSITDLSKAVNLSVPTVTKLIGELIDEGFVHNFGEQGTAGGRRPNIYGLNPYAGYFVGVDLRKDSVMMAVINFKGQLIDETTVDFLMDNDPRSLDRLCDVIQNFIRARKIARDKVLAVGVNISGRVNSQTGYSYSYFFVEEQPLTMLLEERLGTTVYIENDTRAATYGEYMYGDAHSEKTMLYINASWGLGLGMIIDGKIFYGKSGFVPAKTKGVRYADDPEADYFLIKELTPSFLDGISGTYKDPDGYFICEKDPEGFEQFEATFPAKEKQKLPGQLF